MKLTRLALAALVLPSSVMVANAGVTVTPLVGYSWYPSNVMKTQREEVLRDRNPEPNNLPNGVAQNQGDVTAGLAVGIELTPWLQGELEYQQTNADLRGYRATPSPHHPKWDGKQQTVSGNLLLTSDVVSPLLGLDTSTGFFSVVKPYVLAGAGYSRITGDNPGYDYRSYDTIGNIGAGALVQLNDALSLRAEGRAVYNFDHSYWAPQALAGLQVVLGGHLKAAAPVAPVEPVAPPVVVAPEPTPEPPKELTEDLKMELRVFFDINKSNIKAQYKPEVAKVAEKLQEYPNATAKIEGHTDSTGPRKLNERLSLARANAVKSLLVSEFNVSGDRLTTEGYAWDRPIASNKTREGRAMNRRAYAIITGSRTVTVPADQAAPAATPAN